jgi:hypothetical protein
MPPGLFRRDFLQAALGLAALPLIGEQASAQDKVVEGGNAMAKDIVMLHGAKKAAGASIGSRRCSRAWAGRAMRPT